MTSMIAPRPAHEVLAWGHELLEPALRAAIGTLPDASRRVAEFHLGWCDDAGNPAQPARGETIRATVALLIAEAAGGTHDAALPAAIAVELIHYYALLHIDVIDGDVAHGDGPNARSAFGVGPAILTGSALQTLAFDVLAAGGPWARRGVRVLSATIQKLLDDQMSVAEPAARDGRHREGTSTARAEPVALLACACALGHMSATRDRASVSDAETLGGRIGIALSTEAEALGELLAALAEPEVAGAAGRAAAELTALAELLSTAPAR